MVTRRGGIVTLTAYACMALMDGSRAFGASWGTSLMVAACLAAFVIGLRLGAPPLHQRPRARVGDL